MNRTVSKRTLLRHRHIFILTEEGDGRKVVEVWDFFQNKAIISRIAHNDNDVQRYVSSWAKAYKVPPEAIIRDRDPKQYKADIERELYVDEAY